MKLPGCIIAVFLSVFAAAQKTPDYASIDLRVQSIDASTTDSLAKKLTAPYATEKEKVRAVYSWIATHIAYNVGIFSRRTGISAKHTADDDTAIIWKSADEMAADRVLRRRVAVCDGYARLFKVLCTYAGIRSELVMGYVRVVPGSRNSFRTNHTWNAVMIDSSWHLVDPTWGSGFLTYSNQFVQKLDDYYFLTPPYELIWDHYPEDPRWTLLKQSPGFEEFRQAPYKAKAFVKYNVKSFSPSAGLIQAAIGDTIKLVLELADIKRAKQVASSNFDNTIPELPESYALLEPSMERGNKVIYTYVLKSSAIQSLQVHYNKDLIMQYRVNIRQEKEDLLN